MQSERGLSNRECARELYFTGGSRLLLLLSPSFCTSLSRPLSPSYLSPLSSSLPHSLSLSFTHSLFISLALYLGLVINYTDKLGPPAGFSSILYELVPFHPVSFCPAPRHFWFMRAHLRSLSTTGELTSSVSVVCERRL